MVDAFALSARLGHCPPATSSGRARIWTRLGLPTRSAQVSNRRFRADSCWPPWVATRRSRTRGCGSSWRTGSAPPSPVPTCRRPRCARCWPRMCEPHRRPAGRFGSGRCICRSLAVILLLAANAFFVAAEFALVKVRVIRLEALAAAGSRRGARLSASILKHLEAYLAACQLGITMASLGLGWVGEPAVAAVLEPLFPLAGMGEQLLHTRVVRRGLPALLLAAHRHRRAGAQDASRSASRSRSRSGSQPRCTRSSCCAGRSTGRSTMPLAPSCALLGVAEASDLEVYSGAELRQLIGASRQLGEHAQAGARHAGGRSSTSRSSRSAR